MQDSSLREEVLNVELGRLLAQAGFVSAPETILRSARGTSSRLPDVLVVYQGLRIVLEGKVDDDPNASADALDAASRRVEEGLAHIAFGIVYPALLRSVPILELGEALAAAKLRIAVCTEAGTSGWQEADVGHIRDLLGRTYSELVTEDVVGRAVQHLETGIDAFAGAATAVPGGVARAADALGIREV